MMMQDASFYGIKTAELAELSISDQNSIPENRKKIDRVFSLFGYDVFLSTYIATLFSDIFREMLLGQTPKLKISIHGKKEPYFLAFSFSLPRGSGLMRRIKCSFDEVKVTAGPKANHILAFSRLHVNGMSGQLLKELRKALEFKSKEELYRELDSTYTKLNSSKKMAQMEKMSAVGTLSAGIAHELNNPLMGIINFVQYCLKHTPPEDKRHGVLSDAKREALRCAELVQNMLSFSRLEESGVEEITIEEHDIGPVFDEALKLLLYRIEKENVQVVREKSAAVSVAMNRNQLKQVLLSVTSNALDAMRLSKKKILTLKTIVSGKVVSIFIGDTGTGISKDVLSRIFDPFFTTKPVGQGTGLGLTICQTIVGKHAGEIKVNSESGKGTVFEILLPLQGTPHA